jgi:3-oxoacyl-[acyl-carrier protein] reductase
VGAPSPELNQVLRLDLNGRRAVVTGASRGIGAAVVRGLAESGARVAFCARSAQGVMALAGDLKRAGGDVLPFVADMARPDDVQQFLEAVDRELGGADILVNNAGDSPSRNFLHTSDSEWQTLFQLNLLSAVHCTRYLLPGMRARRWGRIVMMASLSAKYPDANLIDYAASKAALLATAKALARKYASDNVLVNSVLPGLIHTSMWDRAAEEIATARNERPEDVFARFAQNVPIGRFGTPEEVASLVVFLVSDYAGYLAGMALDVDGGLGGHIV